MLSRTLDGKADGGRGRESVVHHCGRCIRARGREQGLCRRRRCAGRGRARSSTTTGLSRGLTKSAPSAWRTRTPQQSREREGPPLNALNGHTDAPNRLARGSLARRGPRPRRPPVGNSSCTSFRCHKGKERCGRSSAAAAAPPPVPSSGPGGTSAATCGYSSGSLRSSAKGDSKKYSASTAKNSLLLV